MEKRTLGSLEVSLVGLGCNNFGRRLDEAGSRAVVETALDAGITFFDTADIYGDGRSEEYLGRALGERRATRVSVSRTPRTSGAAAARGRPRGARRGGAARASSGPRRGAPRAAAPLPSGWPPQPRRACAGWGWSASTSPSCTCRIPP